MEDISYVVKYYENEIKPYIEKSNFSEAKTNLFGLLAVLQTEQIKRNLTGNPISYLPSAIASTKVLIEVIEKEDNNLIESCNRHLEIYLKQFKMRLEAQSGRNSALEI